MSQSTLTEGLDISADFLREVPGIRMPHRFNDTWALQQWQQTQHYCVVQNQKLYVMTALEALLWCAEAVKKLRESGIPNAHECDEAYLLEATGLKQVDYLPIPATAAYV